MRVVLDRPLDTHLYDLDGPDGAVDDPREGGRELTFGYNGLGPPGA